jgi:predicted component of type VI protein secretion system|tara:strand:+ start:486 stop:659 length:174 start_codon:yes stop_codon:yes gene_type:complete
MAVSNIYGQKSKYRITLEIEALDDFNPHQINWDKVLDMQDNESVESVIEDLSIPVSW